MDIIKFSKTITVISFSLCCDLVAQTVDAYIMIGQSNTCGRSFASEFTDSSLAQPYSNNISYAFRERSHSTGAVVGNTPLGALRPHTAYASNMVGAEITLGRKLAQNSSNHVMLLTYCSGGTGIRSYLPSSNNLYQPMISWIGQQEALMMNMGYTDISWKAIFSLTGESDTGSAASSVFTGRIKTIQSALANDLNNPNLEFVWGQLNDNLVDTGHPTFDYTTINPGAATVNHNMLTLSENDDLVKVTVSNADLETRFSSGLQTFDGIHYSADSYAIAGERLYNAYTIPEPSSTALLGLGGPALILRRRK